MEKIKPVLILSEGGTWLAVSPPESAMSVGVFGSNREEASGRFQDAVTRRLALDTAAEVVVPPPSF